MSDMEVNAYLYGGPQNGRLVRLRAPMPYEVAKPVSLSFDESPAIRMASGRYTPLAIWRPPLNPIDGNEPLHLYVWGGWSDEPPLPPLDREQVCRAASRQRVTEYQQAARPVPAQNLDIVEAWPGARERLDRWLEDTAWVDSPDAYHWTPDNETSST